MQECLAPDQYHWVPTFLVKADGLTKIDLKLRQDFVLWLQDPVAILSEKGLTVKDQKKNASESDVPHHPMTSIEPTLVAITPQGF